ncbi:hypothetical protein NCU05568 [Neurospora crassa OR74A]|uniref:Uncharacterized protein n=1 Tax=Neurospora crassa (strain ATCC 24698 / 74-OR23-1A / CBS 708.71 / DSM 1257 / FGSC 987) TaxID=367110 RepID=Q7S6Z5_NEUCR|nr:hypothetical protein NCU05568 [Neurospora crassa OR74A]EAA31294.1 hypothetical protein NCU05568 [Neurospora crassa OR74A]|eukprot:XP_960530.1 hypothetical protein NCU05568 [Neurospora crassa OR74A]
MAAGHGREIIVKERSIASQAEVGLVSVMKCACNAIRRYSLIKPFLQSPFLFYPSFVPPSSLNYFFPLLPVLLLLALKLEFDPKPDELDPEELLDVGALMVIVGRKTGIMGVFLRGCDIALSGW